MESEAVSPDAKLERAYWAWLTQMGIDPRKYCNPVPMSDEEVEARLEDLVAGSMKEKE